MVQGQRRVPVVSAGAGSLFSSRTTLVASITRTSPTLVIAFLLFFQEQSERTVFISGAVFVGTLSPCTRNPMQKGKNDSDTRRVLLQLTFHCDVVL